MGESDLAVYEKMLAEVNKYLTNYGISPISRDNYGNLKLKETLGKCKNGNNYKAAMLALSVLTRDDDCKKLSLKVHGIHK